MTPSIDAKAAYFSALSAQAESLGDKAHLLAIPQDAQTGSSSFAATLSQLFAQGIATQQRAEQAGLQALRGEIDQTTLVTAITDAETTLNTVVAVRDRVLSAYQEISRMPI